MGCLLIEEHLSVIHTSHVPLVCVPCEPCGSAWKPRGKGSNGRAVYIAPMFLMGTHDIDVLLSLHDPSSPSPSSQL